MNYLPNLVLSLFYFILNSMVSGIVNQVVKSRLKFQGGPTGYVRPYFKGQELNQFNSF